MFSNYQKSDLLPMIISPFNKKVEKFSVWTFIWWRIEILWGGFSEKIVSFDFSELMYQICVRGLVCFWFHVFLADKIYSIKFFCISVCVSVFLCVCLLVCLSFRVSVCLSAACHTLVYDDHIISFVIDSRMSSGLCHHIIMDYVFCAFSLWLIFCISSCNDVCNILLRYNSTLLYMRPFGVTLLVTIKVWQVQFTNAWH